MLLRWLMTLVSNIQYDWLKAIFISMWSFISLNHMVLTYLEIIFNASTNGPNIDKILLMLQKDSCNVTGMRYRLWKNRHMLTAQSLIIGVYTASAHFLLTTVHNIHQFSCCWWSQFFSFIFGITHFLHGSLSTPYLRRIFLNHFPIFKDSNI